MRYERILAEIGHGRNTNRAGKNANTTGGRKAGEISKLAFLRELFETKWGNRPQIVSLHVNSRSPGTVPAEAYS
jgi:hypothetical protein